MNGDGGVSMNSSIGRQGEKIFSLLGSEAGVSCNKADEDDNGWDYLIEFPGEKTSKPLDLHPAHNTAFAQIKTSRSNARTCRIKLSNARRMANSAQPFFLIFIKLNPGGRPPEIFAIHIWHERIAHFLKAVRIADSNRKPDLHKQEISLTFGKEDLRTDLFGWMKQEIEQAGQDYAHAKREICQRVGFENGYGLANVQVELESEDDFVDFLLGRKDGLRMTHFVYVPERFGIPAGKPEIDVKGGMIYVTPPSKKGILRLSTADGEELACPAEVIVAAEPALPEGESRMRVVAGCLEIISGRGVNSAKASLKLDEQMDLARIAHFNGLLALQDQGRLSVTVMLEGKSYDFGSIELSSNGTDPHWQALRPGIEAVQKVADFAQTKDISLSVADFYETGDYLSYLYALVGAPTVKIASINRDFPVTCQGMISYTGIDVGDWCFLVVSYRPIALQVPGEDKHEAYFKAPRILDAQVERGKSANLTSEFAQRYEKAVERLGADVFELGELQAFVSATDG